ncbi:MAG: hypothetical protein BGO69_04370 [Bacteroidetes bacterium 46-16]|nr:MAG: hypothetical protein BGO69_04370 [Bacteroidetes bacterium 46-16]
MGRKLFLVLLVFYLLPACKTGNEGNGISPAKMRQILYDMNAAEVYSVMVKKEDSSILNRGKNSDSLARYYNEILAHYKVSKEEFDKSMLWYKAHPAKLDSIYNDMISELAKEK